jgi:hypothetical protein
MKLSENLIAKTQKKTDVSYVISNENKRRSAIRYGLVARIPGFHPRGSGSIYTFENM